MAIFIPREGNYNHAELTPEAFAFKAVSTGIFKVGFTKYEIKSITNEKYWCEVTFNNGQKEDVLECSNALMFFKALANFYSVLSYD
jgi:hypothetical protein